MPGWCRQAFGALTNALTTTIKNNTTGRPLSNVEVVSSVRSRAAMSMHCRASARCRHAAVMPCPALSLPKLNLLLWLQVRHFLAAGGFKQNPCLSCSERNANASFII